MFLQRFRLVLLSAKTIGTKQLTYFFLQLMKVHLEQFLGSLCVKTLSFSVIEFLLSRLITLTNHLYMLEKKTVRGWYDSLSDNCGMDISQCSRLLGEGL